MHVGSETKRGLREKKSVRRFTLVYPHDRLAKENKLNPKQ
jgi:hypothetical protein